MPLNQPYGFDGSGKTAQCGDADHLRQSIETLLFTRPGERVNRPDLGSGLFQLVFAPNADELATATQFLIQGALQRWLGGFAQILGVDVSADEATLTVQVRFLPAQSTQPVIASFTRPAPT
jgi:phage baseplate assembly protein W